MDIVHRDITNFFEEILFDLRCHRDTKNYIISIYGKYKSTEFDMSKDSVTLMFAQARDKQDFLAYQNLGDWIFYTKSIFPTFLGDASENYYNNIAQLSYYNCYRMVRSWKIYEELSDEFPILTKKIREKFLKNNSIII